MEGRAQETRPCQLDDPQVHRHRAAHWEVPDKADRAKGNSFRGDADRLHLCRESFDVTITSSIDACDRPVNRFQSLAPVDLGVDRCHKESVG
jgi:hypothetical protein